jgi:hypothetical protein
MWLEHVHVLACILGRSIISFILGYEPDSRSTFRPLKTISAKLVIEQSLFFTLRLQIAQLASLLIGWFVGQFSVWIWGVIRDYWVRVFSTFISLCRAMKKLYSAYLALFSLFRKIDFALIIFPILINLHGTVYIGGCTHKSTDLNSVHRYSSKYFQHLQRGRLFNFQYFPSPEFDCNCYFNEFVCQIFRPN